MGLLVIQTTSALSAAKPARPRGDSIHVGNEAHGPGTPAPRQCRDRGQPRRRWQLTCEDGQDCLSPSPTLPGGAPSLSRGSRQQAGSATPCLPWPRSPASHAAGGAYESGNEPRIRALMSSSRELIALIIAQT